MTIYILISALWLTAGLLLGYSFKRDVPIKRTVEAMNESEALRAEIRSLEAALEQASKNDMPRGADGRWVAK